jgi:hypothetical protein
MATKKLIEKIEKGQPGGNLYAAVDLPDGEWSVDEITARLNSQGEQFVSQYGADNQSQGPGDAKPIAVPKPTNAVVKQY